MNIRWPGQQTRRSASAWFARRQAGDDGWLDRLRFRRWLARDRWARHAYDSTAAIWELSRSVGNHAPIAAAVEQLERRAIRVIRSEQSRPPGRHAWIAAGLAAAVGGIVIALMLHPIAPAIKADYATAVGEQRFVLLPDGTGAQLNTNTRLTVNYTAGTRGVDLLRGEASFSVVKDAHRPFIVRANGGETRAVGTEFVVENSRDVTHVTVLEGRVIVAGSVVSEAHRTERVLIPGESVDYDIHGGVSPSYQGNIARVRAWQAHRILFNNLPLADALREYNRYAATPIIVDAPATADRLISGTFHIGDEAAFLDAIQTALKVVASRESSRIVLHDSAGRSRARP